MQHVSLQAATTLTEWSERTIRRRLADGSLKCAADNEAHYKTMICFDSIKHDICIVLDPDDIELIERADSGDATAQNDLALLFLEKNKLKALFIGWNWRPSNRLPMRCTCWGVVIWKVTAYLKTIVLP